MSTGDDITLVTGVGDDKAYGFELGSLFNYSFAGAALELGLGAAFEDIGLSARHKMPWQTVLSKTCFLL